MNPWPSATPTVDTTSDDTSKMVLSSKSKLLSTVEPEHELTSPPDDSDDTPVWVNDSVLPTPELQSRTCGWRGCEFSDDCWRKRELPRKSTNICTTNSTEGENNWFEFVKARKHNFLVVKLENSMLMLHFESLFKPRDLALVYLRYRKYFFLSKV